MQWKVLISGSCATISCWPFAEISEPSPPPARVRIRRHPERADYDRATVYGILDEGLIAHVGFDDGEGAVVVPMLYARDGDTVYLHGSTLSRAIERTGSEVEVCISVTLIDAIVLARSAFKHSMNYRSAVLFGSGAPVADGGEKRRAMELLVSHIVPGRDADVRGPSEEELSVTGIVAIGIRAASAKVRTGPPLDAACDRGLPAWGGLLPVRTIFGPPSSDDAVAAGTPVPEYIENYRRGE